MRSAYALLILVSTFPQVLTATAAPHADACISEYMVDDAADPAWSVSSTVQSHTINTGAQQVCTYRVNVKAGQPAVKVVVRNGSGNIVSSTTVEGGSSIDVDLAIGKSVHVEYINAASNGTYQKL